MLDMPANCLLPRLARFTELLKTFPASVEPKYKG